MTDHSDICVLPQFMTGHPGVCVLPQFMTGHPGVCVLPQFMTDHSDISAYCFIMKVTQSFKCDLWITTRNFSIWSWCRRHENRTMHLQADVRSTTRKIKFNTVITITPWSECANELYRPSDRRLSAKLLPNFADRMVSRGQRNGSLRP
jgi:hypothetical protein